MTGHELESSFGTIGISSFVIEKYLLVWLNSNWRPLDTFIKAYNSKLRHLSCTCTRLLLI